MAFSKKTPRRQYHSLCSLLPQDRVVQADMRPRLLSPRRQRTHMPPRVHRWPAYHRHNRGAQLYRRTMASVKIQPTSNSRLGHPCPAQLKVSSTSLKGVMPRLMTCQMISSRLENDQRHEPPSQLLLLTHRPGLVACRRSQDHLGLSLHRTCLQQAYPHHHPPIRRSP